MRLSRLHLNGFKSFPDRAELGFDRGVTAIVGPNGCGKSNVVDAITWVLGEQSARSLRGDRMEDIIFNGSDARKPTAAAEVRLKLTQVAQAAMRAAAADADALLDEGPILTRDIEIGRRLYRSGESEYLIDGEVCRLRDVNDLLMDSGLGVKAYAVIEQGKIGQILSSRPAERRMLIEEAAGVTKYKSRRRAAELKLEAAQQNLTRIDDIIFEVEKQRGALRRQAARARRYRRLREELRRWEQVQLAHRHTTLSREIAAADARLADGRAREGAAAAHVAEIEAALEAVRLGLVDVEASATATREAAHARELEIGRRQQQMAFDRRQIEELGLQAESCAAAARDLEARREPARLAIDAQREAASAVRASIDDLSRALTSHEDRHVQGVSAVEAAERDADDGRAVVLAGASTLAALEQAREHTGSIRRRLAEDRERFEIEWRDLERQHESAGREHGAAADELAEARRRLSEARESRTTAETALAAVRAQREALGRSLAEHERDHAAQEARLRSLRELDTSRARFGDAARVLLNEGLVPNVGAVADHLDVARSYERAVDALLGDLLQHVVVTSPLDAARALDLVSGRDAGRCGLVVAEDGHLEAPAPPVKAGGAVALRDVVHARGPHAALLERLVGDAFIVAGSDEARSLARQVDLAVATKDGEIWRGAWRVEGGSRRETLGILETRAEVQTLADAVADLTRTIDRCRHEVEALDTSIRAAEAVLTGAIDREHHEDKAIIEFEGRVRQSQADIARLDDRLVVVTTERARAEEEERAAAARHEETEQTIGQRQVEHAGAQTGLAGVIARLQVAREQAEAAWRLVMDVRSEHARLSERATAFEIEIVRLGEAERDLEDRAGAQRAAAADALGRREALIEAVRDAERVQDDEIRALETCRDEVRDLDARLSDLRTAFDRQEREIREARYRFEAIRTEVMQLEVAKATATAELGHLATAAFELVNASIEEVIAAVARMEEAGELEAPGERLALAAAPDAEEESEESADAPEAGREARDAEGAAPVRPDDVIATLKSKIDRLGAVNMMAIEQFDELETRHGFLVVQRKDLLDAIAQTGEAIDTIDKTTHERFDEAFAIINRHFETTFTTLFGGGRAGLVLIDQENDVESGIDIIAQPPGKRLQNVQLLSGGEKALTAMALMFAIFKHRPSPFCLLDEIDAPLDDANIGRFVEMLQGMQEHTQFILITHNRKTMEIANRLYGVTMEEPGVSKLISMEMQ